jgi:hypothetical protein
LKDDETQFAAFGEKPEQRRFMKKGTGFLLRGRSGCGWCNYMRDYRKTERILNALPVIRRLSVGESAAPARANRQKNGTARVTEGYAVFFSEICPL